MIAPDLPGFGMSSSPTVDEYDYTAHIYDGGHLLLETHAAECAQLMLAFVLDNTRVVTGP